MGSKYDPNIYFFWKPFAEKRIKVKADRPLTPHFPTPQSPLSRAPPISLSESSTKLPWSPTGHAGVRTAPVPHSSYSRNSQVPRPPCLRGRRCEELPHPCLLAAATISYLLVSSPPCSSTQRHGCLHCAAPQRPSEITPSQAHRQTPAPHQATTHASTSWWSQSSQWPSFIRSHGSGCSWCLLPLHPLLGSVPWYSKLMWKIRGPCAWWMTSPLGTPRGRYDEYSSLFSLS
jgi:hypothetical protein